MDDFLRYFASSSSSMKPGVPFDAPPLSLIIPDRLLYVLLSLLRFDDLLRFEGTALASGSCCSLRLFRVGIITHSSSWCSAAAS